MAGYWVVVAGAIQYYRPVQKESLALLVDVDSGRG